MTATIIIPARGGSKGIPRKNLAPLCGKPLLAWAIEAALKSNVGTVYVSTEDEEIADAALSFGAGVITRPDALASDIATSESVIVHAIDALGLEPDSTVVMVQPTSPLVTPEEIRQCAVGAQEYGGAFTAYQTHEQIWLGDVPITATWRRGGRQGARRYMAESGAVYATTADQWRTHGRFGRGTPAVMPMHKTVEIDEPRDLIVAEALMRDRLERASAEEKPRGRVDMSKITTLILDFDGVLTDNHVDTNSKGRESVRCSKADSVGIRMAHDAGLNVRVITQEEDTCVDHRCNKLVVWLDHADDKLQRMKDACVDMLHDLAYIGNDLPDVECMRAAAVSFAPADAEQCAKDAATFVLKRKGGDGAVREAIEMLLEARKQ